MLASVSKVSRIGLSVARASSTARVWIDKNTRVIGQGITGKNVGSVFVLPDAVGNVPHSAGY